MERVSLKESSAKIREFLERVSPDSPLLDTEEGTSDRIGQVLYVLEGVGYAVVSSEDQGKAANLKLALETFVS